MPVDVKYRTTATATGGRDGHAATKDGALDVTAVDAQGAGRRRRPRQQPRAAVRGRLLGLLHRCHEVRGLAGRAAKVPNDTSVTTTVGIGPRSEGGFGLDVEMEVSLPGVDKAAAEALVEKAHQVCPYSNAIRGNVNVRTRVA